ncbi:MAG: ribonuclease III [Clostridia bacterium]|nr:ribonuclease III [Clostridia bacterium]
MLQVTDYPQSFRRRADVLQERIGYKFENELVLYEALTHASFANEHREEGFPFNERIEFMGDSVLNFSVTRHIYAKYPDLDEGELSKLRAGTVCDAALADYGKSIGLDECLLLGHGERQSGVVRRSIVADATEALFAAIFFDAGLEKAAEFILSLVGDKIGELVAGASLRDSKSILHEMTQTDPGSKLEYVLLAESGPDHDKRFETEVRLNSNPIGRGVGRSKRESEQAAAAEALRLFGVK